MFTWLGRLARWRGWRRLVLGMFAMGMVWLLTLAAVIHVYGYQDEARPADAIVVLGAGLRRDNQPTSSLRHRSRRGAELYLAGVAPRVICTGGFTAGRTRSEADACREILLAAGVPFDAILLEERSRSTEENALFTRELLAADGHTRVVVVSSRYHLLRARWLFSRVGLNVVTSPATNSDLRVSQYAYSLFREVAAFHWQVLKDAFGLPFTYVPVF